MFCLPGYGLPEIPATALEEDALQIGVMALQPAHASAIPWQGDDDTSHDAQRNQQKQQQPDQEVHHCFHPFPFRVALLPFAIDNIATINSDVIVMQLSKIV